MDKLENLQEGDKVYLECGYQGTVGKKVVVFNSEGSNDYRLELEEHQGAFTYPEKSYRTRSFNDLYTENEVANLLQQGSNKALNLEETVVQELGSKK